MAAESKSLDALRREIDEIDEGLHDLLMRRAALAADVRAAKGDEGAAVRPAREAAVLRRLIARHQGPFPVHSLIALWREIFAALTALQGPFSVAVQTVEKGAGLHLLARAHFGAFTTIRDYTRAGHVVGAVGEKSATLGVLPLPSDSEEGRWWRFLLSERPERVRVVARLPMVRGLGGEAGPDAEALVVAAGPAEATGEDRSYVVFQSQEEISRGRLKTALATHGLTQLYYDSWRDTQAPVAWHHLVELDGFVESADARLRRLADGFEPAIDTIYGLGGYPLPLDLSAATGATSAR